MPVELKKKLLAESFNAADQSLKESALPPGKKTADLIEKESLAMSFYLRGIVGHENH